MVVENNGDAEKIAGFKAPTYSEVVDRYSRLAPKYLEVVEKYVGLSAQYCDRLDQLISSKAKTVKLRDALLLVLKHNPCPCGARQDSLNTHPHVAGCVVEAALRRIDPKPVHNAALVEENPQAVEPAFHSTSDQDNKLISCAPFHPYLIDSLKADIALSAEYLGQCLELGDKAVIRACLKDLAEAWLPEKSELLEEGQTAQ
jgi:hypothetical protein